MLIRSNLPRKSSGRILSRPSYTAILLYYFLLSFDFVAVTSGVSVGRIVACLVLFAGLLQVRSLRVPIDPPFISMLVFMIASLCSILFLPAYFFELSSYFTIFLNLAVVLIICSTPMNEVDCSYLEHALLAAALVLAVACIVSPGQVGDEWVTGRIVANIGGSQQDPNEFCGYFLLPVSVFSLSFIRNRNLLSLMLLAFMLYTVLMTGSRGGLLAVVAALFVAVILAAKDQKNSIIIAVFALLIFLLLLVSFDAVLDMLPKAIARRFDLSDASMGTASARVNGWNDILESFLNSSVFEQILGHGYGTTTFASSIHLVAHNVYIELLYDVGLIGLISFLFVYFYSCFQAFKTNHYALFAAMIGESVLMFSLSSFWSKTLWGLLALGLVYGELRKKRQ